MLIRSALILLAASMASTSVTAGSVTSTAASLVLGSASVLVTVASGTPVFSSFGGQPSSVEDPQKKRRSRGSSIMNRVTKGLFGSNTDRKNEEGEELSVYPPATNSGRTASPLSKNVMTVTKNPASGKPELTSSKSVPQLYDDEIDFNADPNATDLSMFGGEIPVDEYDSFGEKKKKPEKRGSMIQKILRTSSSSLRSQDVVQKDKQKAASMEPRTESRSSSTGRGSRLGSLFSKSQDLTKIKQSERRNTLNTLKDSDNGSDDIPLDDPRVAFSADNVRGKGGYRSPVKSRQGDDGGSEHRPTFRGTSFVARLRQSRKGSRSNSGSKIGPSSSSSKIVVDYSLDERTLKLQSDVMLYDLEQTDAFLKRQDATIPWEAEPFEPYLLEPIGNDFHIVGALVRGRKANVFIAESEKVKDKIFLVKMLVNFDQIRSDLFTHEVERQIGVYDRIKGCPNVMHYLQHREVNGIHYLFMEYFPGVPLESVSKMIFEKMESDVNNGAVQLNAANPQCPTLGINDPRYRLVNGPVIQSIERMTTETMKCIHDHNLSYQDLHGGNVMVSFSGTKENPTVTVKLIDFDTMTDDNGSDILFTHAQGGDKSQHPALYKQIMLFEEEFANFRTDKLDAAKGGYTVPSGQFSDAFSVGQLAIKTMLPETEVCYGMGLFPKTGKFSNVIQNHPVLQDPILQDFLRTTMSAEIVPEQLPKNTINHPYLSRQYPTVPLPDALTPLLDVSTMDALINAINGSEAGQLLDSFVGELGHGSRNKVAANKVVTKQQSAASDWEKLELKEDGADDLKSSDKNQHRRLSEDSSSSSITLVD